MVKLSNAVGTLVVSLYFREAKRLVNEAKKHREKARKHHEAASRSSNKKREALGKAIASTDAAAAVAAKASKLSEIL